MAPAVFLFQNCEKMSPAAYSESSQSGYSITIVNPDGTITVLPTAPTPPQITVVAPLAPSQAQIIAGDTVTLSSDLTSNTGTLQYRWFRADADTDAQALRAALMAKDAAAVSSLISTGKAVEFASRSSRFPLPGTAVSDSGTYHLAAFIAGNLLSFQSLRLNILEFVPYIQTFSAPGSFMWRKPPSGITATVECWGGGGSGGSGGVGSGRFGPPQSSGGGGGGGGGYSRATLSLAALGATEPVVIGRGGAGGSSGPVPTTGTIVINNGVLANSAALLANGFPGENSVFGNNLVVAGGGGAGTRSLSLGQPGTGGPGGSGTTANGAAGSNAAIPGGNGGSSGGPGSIPGNGGYNGTGPIVGNVVQIYYSTGGLSGSTGAGGGGGGGNAYGASGGGSGGNGRCVISVTPNPQIAAIPAPVPPTPPIKFKKFTGNGANCGITMTDTVKCWGPGRSLVRDVDGFTGVAQFYGDTGFGCALTAGGTVLCAGANSFGQLGNGTTVASTVPVAVSGLAAGVRSISTGSSRACAVTAAGGVSCWGNGIYGALARSPSVDSAVPLAIPGVSNAVAVVSGSYHNCALLSNGTVSCWGSSFNNAVYVEDHLPATVPNLTGAKAIAAGGYSTCAIDAADGVRCWGGQFGIHPLSTAAVPVPGLTGVSAIRMGSGTACALMNNGSVRCWGSGFAGSPIVPINPAEVLPANSAKDIAVGFSHLCALTPADTVKCWGLNTGGQLGNDGTANSGAVIQSPILGNFQSIKSGPAHRCGLTAAGNFRCWGSNGTVVNSDTPVDVPNSAGTYAYSMHQNHSCFAVRPAGNVRCWGNNYVSDFDRGLLGNGTQVSSAVPVEVTGLTGVRELSLGQTHSCALLSDESVSCWGSNRVGQLGNGADITVANGAPSALVPAAVPGATGVQSLSSGNTHTCALLKTGTVRCWGGNTAGQLGVNTLVNSSIPLDVPGLTGVKQIAAAGSYTCVITSANGVKCWGQGTSGQLGNGAIVNSPVPVDVVNLTDAADLSLSANHACVTLTSGAVKCWGSNSHGQLGDLTNALSSAVPVDLRNRQQGSKVVCGPTVTMQVQTAGAVYLNGILRSTVLAPSGEIH